MKSKLNLIIAILLIALCFTGIKLNAQALQNTYSEGNPSILVFSTAMCHDCKKLKKTFKVVYPDYRDKINFTFIDSSRMNSQQRQQAKKYRVRVVPTMIYIDKNNQYRHKTEGSMSESQLRNNMEELLK